MREYRLKTLTNNDLHECVVLLEKGDSILFELDTVPGVFLHVIENPEQRRSPRVCAVTKDSDGTLVSVEKMTKQLEAVGLSVGIALGMEWALLPKS